MKQIKGYESIPFFCVKNLEVRKNSETSEIRLACREEKVGKKFGK